MHDTAWKTCASYALTLPQGLRGVTTPWFNIHQTHPVSRPVTSIASAELLRPARLKLSEFLDIDLDSPKLTRHAGKAEVVATVIKCGRLFFDSLNAK